MRLNIDIDENHEETSVTIQAKEWSEELEEIAAVIKKRKQRRLFGMDEEQTVLLNPHDIDYIYAQKRKVFAVIKDRELEIRMKLYEIEEILIPYQFMRFSKSVIGNLGRIERFELSFNGNLCVYFQSGNKEYITRKYVKPIKDQLMKGGQ
ncbi:response regulator, LytTR family protein [Oceanobacillus picturae]|uniref:Response regulator, LytTR family protein n=1 Tax=Oceanobacillus picturae TaxID=171693 RepID=A0A0U9H2H9_9BACI|nr:LytTR family DNA-binding domain-containing protein [Oceanobacillus picturae]GAQ16539.1 response regulator, LytTR family protein [Oceanobacillus picturae]